MAWVSPFPERQKKEEFLKLFAQEQAYLWLQSPKKTKALSEQTWQRPTTEEQVALD